MNKRSEFKSLHPFSNLIYFISAIGFSCYVMHPVCLVVSLLSGFIYSIILKGAKAFKFFSLFMIPVALTAVVLNPLFNHRGMTILAYLPDGNPLTFESIFYGIFAALMILSVIVWFSCFNEIMTSDKLICLFGKIIPSLSLILSMTFRFVPRFITQLKEITIARKCMGKDIGSGSIKTRIKNGASVLSAMITLALENSIDTADSMKSRGYGLKKRTSFSIFSFTKRDAVIISATILLSAIIITGYVFKVVYVSYFPKLSFSGFSTYETLIYTAYIILLNLPLIMEVRIWKF